MAKLKEEWKVIEGYPKYSVSNLGRVKKRLMLNPTATKEGYKVVGLTNEEGRKKYSVHRLVANAFLEKVEGEDMVSHLDGNGLNNKVENLIWVKRSNITNEDVLFIRKNAKKNGGSLSNAEMARTYDVSTVAIYKIVNGINRKGGGSYVETSERNSSK